MIVAEVLSRQTTIWTDAAGVRAGREEKEFEENKSEERRSSARKGKKIANTLLFPMFCGFRGSKSRLKSKC